MERTPPSLRWFGFSPSREHREIYFAKAPDRKSQLEQEVEDVVAQEDQSLHSAMDAKLAIDNTTRKAGDRIDHAQQMGVSRLDPRNWLSPKRREARRAGAVSHEVHSIAEERTKAATQEIQGGAKAAVRRLLQLARKRSLSLDVVDAEIATAQEQIESIEKRIGAMQQLSDQLTSLTDAIDTDPFQEQIDQLRKQQERLQEAMDKAQEHREDKLGGFGEEIDGLDIQFRQLIVRYLDLSAGSSTGPLAEKLDQALLENASGKPAQLERLIDRIEKAKGIPITAAEVKMLRDIAKRLSGGTGWFGQRKRDAVIAFYSAQATKRHTLNQQTDIARVMEGMKQMRVGQILQIAAPGGKGGKAVVTGVRPNGTVTIKAGNILTGVIDTNPDGSIYRMVLRAPNGNKGHYQVTTPNIYGKDGKIKDEYKDTNVLYLDYTPAP